MKVIQIHTVDIHIDVNNLRVILSQTNDNLLTEKVYIDKGQPLQDLIDYLNEVNKDFK